MLQPALLSYIKLIKMFDTDRFKYNPCYPCVANNIIEGESLTIVFRVDEDKARHKEKNVV